MATSIKFAAAVSWKRNVVTTKSLSGSYWCFKNWNDDAAQRRFCTMFCAAHNTASIGTHQASRHSQQQLEERKVAGLTVKRTRKQTRSNNKNNAAQMSLLQNRHTRNHTGVALKASEHFIKTCHLPAGTVQILFGAKLFRSFFCYHDYCIFKWTINVRRSGKGYRKV